MGRLVGVGANKAPKTYTEEDVKKLTSELEAKVQEVVDENTSLRGEKTALEAKVQEVVNANDSLIKEKKELEKQVKALTKDKE